MPEKETIRRAARDKRQGKSASTQAGEFVREEIHHVREGKHGARSTKQAIAIGLAKARRQGVKLPAEKKGEAPAATRRKEKQDLAAGRHPKKSVSRKRSRATREALNHEGHSAASRSALSRQAKTAAKQRTASDRSAAAKKASRTKGPAKRHAAAKKAARTRARHARN
jgi:hypothetical protein